MLKPDNSLPLRVVVSGKAEVQELFAEFILATIFGVSCLPPGLTQSRKTKVKQGKYLPQPQKGGNS